MGRAQILQPAKSGRLQDDTVLDIAHANKIQQLPCYADKPILRTGIDLPWQAQARSDHAKVARRFDSWKKSKYNTVAHRRGIWGKQQGTVAGDCFTPFMKW
jgi:hypothetical protein